MPEPRVGCDGCGRDLPVAPGWRAPGQGASRPVAHLTDHGGICSGNELGLWRSDQDARAEHLEQLLADIDADPFLGAAT